MWTAVFLFSIKMVGGLASLVLIAAWDVFEQSSCALKDFNVFIMS